MSYLPSSILDTGGSNTMVLCFGKACLKSVKFVSSQKVVLGEPSAEIAGRSVYETRPRKAS